MKYQSTKYTCVFFTQTQTQYLQRKAIPRKHTLEQGKSPAGSQSQKNQNFQEGGKKKGKSKIHPPIHGSTNTGGKGSGISARSQKNTFLKLKKN